MTPTLDPPYTDLTFMSPLSEAQPVDHGAALRTSATTEACWDWPTSA